MSWRRQRAPWPTQRGASPNSLGALQCGRRTDGWSVGPVELSPLGSKGASNPEEGRSKTFYLANRSICLVRRFGTFKNEFICAQRCRLQDSQNISEETKQETENERKPKQVKISTHTLLLILQIVFGFFLFFYKYFFFIILFLFTSFLL